MTQLFILSIFSSRKKSTKLGRNILFTISLCININVIYGKHKFKYAIFLASTYHNNTKIESVYIYFKKKHLLIFLPQKGIISV